MTTKGQATIPKEVRERLHLKPGDKVKFFFHPDGHVAILPKVPASTLKGIVKSRLGRPSTLEEMDESIADEAVARTVRSKRR